MRRPCTEMLCQVSTGWRLHLLTRSGAYAALIAVFLCAFQLATALAQNAKPPAAGAGIRENILGLLSNEKGMPLPIKQRREALQAYYKDPKNQILWLEGNRAEAFISRLRNAERDGLDPSDYPSKQLASLIAAKSSADVRNMAATELYFSAAFIQYASALNVGRFLPSKVDPNFFLKGRSIDQLSVLVDVLKMGDVDRTLDKWQPSNPRYLALRSALARYRKLATAGGWGTIPLGPALRPGMSDSRVPAIRARLAVTDGANTKAPSSEQKVYDKALVEAVKRFQVRNGAAVDGIIGSGTIVAMNVPVQDRINSIIMAMERLRWMPENLGRQYLVVNIAGFELRRVNAGVVEEQMAVVVGKPYHRTPVFSDRIRYLEFNPYWNVPPSILINEELPKLRRNPAGLAARGFELVQGDRVIDPRSVDWSRYGSGRVPFTLRQKPGARNALGRVKFMFPNPHNVYLHDTPSRSLFSRNMRAFSHGCIRLARPLELADQVLRVGGVPGWDKRRIDSVVASDKRTVVNLKEPLPVHITYMTAWVDNGVANFRQDIYGHDTKLLAALSGKATAW
jgi:murein L,D-transpeptidase YcbB/YkuD